MKYTRMPTRILKQTIDLLESSEEEASVMVYKIASDLHEAESDNRKSTTAKRLRSQLDIAIAHLHELRVFIDWNKAILDKDNPNYKQNMRLMREDVAVNERPQKTHGRTLKEIRQQFQHIDRLTRNTIIENLIRTGQIQVEETAKEIMLCSTEAEKTAFDKCFNIE
jgi:hypothetical protein